MGLTRMRVCGTWTLVSAGGLGLFMLACNTTNNSQQKYVDDAAVQLATDAAWNNQSVKIVNANGSITVHGDPRETNVRALISPFAFASIQQDGDDAVLDVSRTVAFVVDPSNILIQCGLAAAGHGSADAGTTGCDMTVTVPFGSVQSGVALSIQSGTGPVTIQDIVGPTAVGDGGAGPITIAVNGGGNITATRITGSFLANTASGTVVASVLPTLGAVVDIASQNGGVTLALPGDFAADSLLLITGSGSIVVQGADRYTGPFRDIRTDVLDGGRGQPGTGAARIKLYSKVGDVTLQPL